MPSISSLALTAICNGLEHAKLTSSTTTPPSNVLSASPPIYPSNLPTVNPSLYQTALNYPPVGTSLEHLPSYFPMEKSSLSPVSSNSPNMGPSLPQMASNYPFLGKSLEQLASYFPIERPSLSPMSSGSPSMGPSLSEMASNLPSTLSNFPIASSNSQTAGVDVSVLNNLAIALQLMILSNILNTPLEDGEQKSSSNPEPVDSFHNPIKPVSVSYMPVNNNENQYINVQTQNNDDIHILRNANFLGSSNFAENPMMLHNFGGNPVLQGCPKNPPSPRAGFTLMSPYEALGPNSPFSDPILSSPYALNTGRSDFNSPYSSFESYSGFDCDLFSMTDIL